MPLLTSTVARSRINEAFSLLQLCRGMCPGPCHCMAVVTIRMIAAWLTHSCDWACAAVLPHGFPETRGDVTGSAHWFCHAPSSSSSFSAFLHQMVWSDRSRGPSEAHEAEVMQGAFRWLVRVQLGEFQQKDGTGREEETEETFPQ